MTSLAGFQDGFARALVGIEPPQNTSPQARDAARRFAFSVYRNTMLKGCIDALVANYPTVATVVGEEWFRAAAALYAREQPPRTPMLILYGHGFANFLDTFQPARELPYLPALARMDRLWSEAHVAADAAPLAPDVFASLNAGSLADAHAVLHPSARLFWCDHTAPSLWLETRGYAPERDEAVIESRSDGVLIVRPHQNVCAIPLTPGGAAFLAACDHGRDLASASASALSSEPGLDLSALFAELLELGAFTELVLTPVIGD